MTAHITPNLTRKQDVGDRDHRHERSGALDFTVPDRFCGPPGTGNGGWIAGNLARCLPHLPAQVTLRAPAPLGRPLTVLTTADRVRLLDGDTLCAEAIPTGAHDFEVPAPVGVDDAADASAAFVGHHEHPFPTCFVCGPTRDPTMPCGSSRDPSADDPAWWRRRGCRVGRSSTPTGSVSFAPRRSGRRSTVPRDGLTTNRGCRPARAAQRRLIRPVRAGEDYVVVAQRSEVDGRKLHATGPLYAADGTLHASARALWITPV